MKQFYVLLMSFALVMQIISNGLFIPMTASATEDVKAAQTTNDEQKLEQAKVFIADLFTDDTYIDIKKNITEAQLATAQDYAQAVTDETTKKALMQQIALATAFMKVNALLDGDQAKEDITADMITEATTAANAVEEASKVSEASLNEKLAIVKDAQAAEQQVANHAEATEAKDTAKTSEKVEKKAVLKTKSLSGEQLLKDHIENIQLTKGYLSEDLLDTESGLKIDQEFGVRADIEFAEAIEAGTVFSYDIPAGTYIKEAGQVDLTGDIKGTLSWGKDGKIQLKVNQDLPAGTSGGFIFRSWVASSVNETPWQLNYETKDENGKTIPLSIKEADKPKPVLKKAGSNNNISYDTKILTYTIEFSGVEGAEAVADKLPEGVTFKNLTSITRAEYNKFTGQYSEPKDDIKAWTREKTDTGFNLTREDGIGVDKYKIEYTVDVTNPQLLNKVEANKVSLVNNTSKVSEVASKAIEIKHADAYQKEAVDYNASTQTIKWHIVYNLNGKNLSAQTIKDYFSNDFVFGNLNVYKAELETNDDGSPKAVATKEKLSSVSVTTQKETTVNCPSNQTSCQHVAIDMPEVNGDTYIIEYTTKANGLVTGGTAYNEAIIGEQKLTAEQVLTNTLGTKYGVNNEIDYANKTASWVIELNKSEQGEIQAGAVITDTFETKGMTLDENSFEITVGQEKKTLAELGITLTKIEENNGGFTLEFANAVPKNTIIKYKTKFDVIKSTDGKLRNVAKLTYNGLENSFVLGKYNQFANVESRDDGNKSGVYNPETKTIKWTVNINYYGKKIVNPVLKDTLESNQTYVKGSLKVYEASVSKQGEISRGEESVAWTVDDYAGQKDFTLTGPTSIDKPYQIVYETKIDATKDVHKAEMYENTAVLTSEDTTLSTFTKTPTGLDHGDEFINKDYKKNGNKQYNWTVDINRSQSELQNVIVEDTQTGELTLDPSSFKLERYDYDEGQKIANIPVTVATEAPTVVPENTAVLVMTGERYFKLYLGDVERAYKLTYTSYYEGEPTGETLTNKAKLYTGEESKASNGTDGITLSSETVAYVTGLAWLNYKPTLVVHKIAAQTSNGVDVKVEDLANISFELYDETQSVLLDKGVTDANGNLIFNKQLAPGYYYLLEDTILADYKPFGENYKGTGYETDYTSTKDQTQTLSLTKTINGKRAIRVEVSADTVNDNKQVALTVKNYLKEPKGCQQTFINKDGDKVLKGSEYKVTDTEGNTIVENIKADNDGKIVTPTLPKGDYVLVQTKTPDGYDADTEKAEDVTFTVADECTTAPTVVENTHACKDFNITFENAEQFPDYVAQSTFKLVDEKGQTVVSADGKLFENIQIGEDGKTTLSNVPTGDYQLVQVDVPVGYKKLDNIDVSINSTSCKAGMTVEIPTDKKTLACPQFYILVEGLDEDISSFSKNAKFDLVDENGAIVTSNDKPLTDLTINFYGKIVLDGKIVGSEDLPLDSQSYTLVQTNTVNGYKVLNEKVVASGTDCYAVVTVEKTVCPDYYIQVVDDKGNAITNTEAYASYVEKARFTLTANDGKTIDNVQIGTDGKLSVDGKTLEKEDLPAISYTLTQTNSVDGFYKLQEKVTPQADDCYAVVKIDVTNAQLQCTETQFIVDENVPAGVTYVIENADKTVSYTLETVEKDGKIVLQAAEDSTMPKVLSNGEYTVTTTKVPAGYAKAPVETVTVTDENEKDCVTPVTVKIVECPDFTVYYEGPKDSTATFTLRKTDGTIVEENITVVTNDEGVATLHFTEDTAKHLQAGTYELVQTKVPTGYNAASKQTFTVTDEACAEAFTVINKKILPTPEKCDKPVITVTPATGEQPEAGTKVTLVTEGKTLTGTVDQTGNVKIDNDEKLTPGKSVEITVEGYEPVTTTLEETKCQNEVTITPLPACEKVPTITIDPSVKPAEDTKVTVTPEGGSPITGKTDKDGKVVFDNEPTLTPGEKVTITVDGFKPVTAVIPTECGANITVTPEVLGCAQFDVVVKDANGEAVSGATVTVDGTNIVGLTDEAGKVQLTNKDFAMTAGSIIIITKEGFETKQVTISGSDDRACAVTVVFDKVEDVKVCPQFTLNPTEDIIGATVTVTGETTVTGQVDSDGNIVYDNDAKPELTPGTTIVISKEGFESKTIIIDADSTNCEVSLSLIKKPKACPQFTVTVKDENGPVSGAHVFVKGTNASGTTNEQGQVVLENKDITENSVIEIAKDGYATQTVKANEDCEVTVTMTKATTEDPKDPTDPSDEPGKTPGDTTEEPGNKPEDPKDPTDETGKTPDEGSTTPEDPNEKPDNTPSITPPVINPVPSTPENPDGTPGNPGGTTENPDGTPGNPGGTTENPGGTTENPGGTTENPGGTTENPGGTTENPGGTTENPDGTSENPDGTSEDPNGTTEDPDGTSENPDGTSEDPDGTSENPDGTTEDPDGTPEDPKKPSKKPTNSVSTPNKKPGNSSGDSTVTPDGKDDDTTPTPVTGKQLPNGKVNIPVNATPGVYYDLYDSEGNLIASNVLANADGSITLDESLASGTYTLKPVNGNGEEITFAYDGLEEAAGQAGNNQAGNNQAGGHSTGNQNTNGAGDQTAGNTGNTNNQVAGNHNNGNQAKAKSTTLLPQTGTQVAFYTLFGIVLIGAALCLFKRSRRKAS